jgi:hypothetical protein
MNIFFQLSDEIIDSYYNPEVEENLGAIYEFVLIFYLKAPKILTSLQCISFNQNYISLNYTQI